MTERIKKCCEANASREASRKQAQEQTRRLFELLVQEMKRLGLSPTYVEKEILAVRNGYFKHISDGSSHPKVEHFFTLVTLIAQRHQWGIERYRYSRPDLFRTCVKQYEEWQRRLWEALLKRIL